MKNLKSMELENLLCLVEESAVRQEISRRIRARDWFLAQMLIAFPDGRFDVDRDTFVELVASPIADVMFMSMRGEAIR